MYFFILLTNSFNLVVQPGPLIHLCKRWLKFSMTSLFEISKPLRMKSRKVQSTIQCNLSVRLGLTNLTCSTIHFLSTKTCSPHPLPTYAIKTYVDLLSPIINSTYLISLCQLGSFLHPWSYSMCVHVWKRLTLTRRSSTTTYRWLIFLSFAKWLGSF